MPKDDAGHAIWEFNTDSCLGIPEYPAKQSVEPGHLTLDRESTCHTQSSSVTGTDFSANDNSQPVTGVFVFKHGQGSSSSSSKLLNPSCTDPDTDAEDSCQNQQKQSSENEDKKKGKQKLDDQSYYLGAVLDVDYIPYPKPTHSADNKWCPCPGCEAIYDFPRQRVFKVRPDSPYDCESVSSTPERQEFGETSAAADGEWLGHRSSALLKEALERLDDSEDWNGSSLVADDDDSSVWEDELEERGDYDSGYGSGGFRY